MYTPFLIGFNYNMDHMRISGTEPSSVILSQTMKFKKLKSYDRKLPKQAEVKRDGVINPQNYNFSQYPSVRLHMSLFMYYIEIIPTEHVLKYVLYSNQSDWARFSLCIIYKPVRRSMF